MGLRDEKKQATRAAIADAALRLFLEKGFDRVTVAEVARAAHVSVNTAFNYFPTKEDLLFDRQDEVVQRLSHAVRDRRPGESPAAAAHRAFLDRLDRDDPTLGLTPDAVRFWRLIDGSPALQARTRLLHEMTETALAAALAESFDPTTARLTAALLTAADRALHTEIRHRVTRGDPPTAVRTAITTVAARLFTVLDDTTRGC
ncbi:TetR family transcriptional regulator [Actinoplanes utahensis]|uniref:TetR family transcriptional regulator n=1 Tax=Actinoplanes utahensis TaxID=1869 RepID=A0A0A6UWB4_ACTUT|nr:TetR family transcriptional regulator [Actinoplanes utahensis]KHD79203.1 TetR family transcriptional regulator [Actinoplanes utahensis]GIF30389.1 hypothetical protein Aut01nite_33750 [Actinoplanes utahensis]